MLQRFPSYEFRLQELTVQAVGGTRALHYRPAQRCLTAHEQRNPDDAVVTDDGDFG